MAGEVYSFRVGQFQCTLVSDGTFAYPHPAQMFFVNAEQDELKRALQAYDLDPETWETYVSPYPSLLTETGQNRVLVDTGAGQIAPTTGRLMANLQAQGIDPESIDTVILSHGHPDHIGGNLDAGGKPAFANARYVMWQDEWNFWTSDPDLSPLPLPDELKGLLLGVAQQNLPPIEGQLKLITAEEEIVPGIEAVSAPGHTPGHMTLCIGSDGKQLLHIVDTAMLPLHLERPDWIGAVDYSPADVVATRQKPCQRAAADEALVMAFHFPFPCLGHIVPKGAAWEWRPLE